MNNLFLFLGIIIVFVVVIGAALILRHKRIQEARADMMERLERELYTDHYFEDDEYPLNPPSDGQFDSAEEKLQIPDDFVEPRIEEKVEKVENAPYTSLKPDDKNKLLTKKSDLIIALHVVTEDEAGFAGHDVLKVLEELGLKYGKMNIFHHYGLGDSKVQQPVYSVANLVEPGTFDPYNMPDFTTPGLAVFMRLPGPFGGRVAFELMLNNTQQIAEMLDGYIEDETHMLLDQRMISRLRERIAYFEQRGTRLSLRVRVS